MLDTFEDAPTAELLKKGTRRRCCFPLSARLRELAADLHRAKSAPWPSSLAKEKAKAAILALAERGTPNFDTMIEHGSRLAFPMVSMQSMVHGTETPALAFAEGTDSIGLICWLLRDQMQARINAGIDEVADDKNALDERQRADMTAQITADELLIQRAECSLIWHAEAQGEIIDFRADTSPLALLGIQLRTAPAINPSPGTSRDHGYDVVYGRRG